MEEILPTDVEHKYLLFAVFLSHGSQTTERDLWPQEETLLVKYELWHNDVIFYFLEPVSWLLQG